MYVQSISMYFVHHTFVYLYVNNKKKKKKAAEVISCLKMWVHDYVYMFREVVENYIFGETTQNIAVKFAYCFSLSKIVVSFQSN